MRLSGQATASPAEVSTSGLHIEVPGAGVDVKGKVELAKRLLALGLRVGSTNLPRLLASLGVPPLAQEASVAVDLAGSMEQPRASGQIEIKGIGGRDGIPSVPSFETKFHLQDGTLQVDSLAAEVAGGTLAGSGTLKLFEKTVQHMLRSPNLEFRLEGKQIALESLITGGLVSGKIAFEVTASGPLRRPKIRFKMPAGVTAHVLGQSWQLGGIDLEVDQEGVAVRLLQASGKTGGEIQIEGHMRFVPKAMPMRVAPRVTDLPVAAVLAAAQVDLPAAGRLSVDLRLSGSSKAPLVEGSIGLAGVTVMGVALGDANLTLHAMESGVAVKGTLFNRFTVDAIAQLNPAGLRAKASLSFSHLVLEDLALQLRGNREIADLVKQLKDLDAHAVLSGHVGVEVQPGKPLAIQAVLTELAASIRQEITEPGGQVSTHRIGLRNDGDLRATVAGDHIALGSGALHYRRRPLQRGRRTGGRIAARGALRPTRLGIPATALAQEIPETGRRCQSGSEGVRDHEAAAGGRHPCHRSPGQCRCPPASIPPSPCRRAWFTCDRMRWNSRTWRYRWPGPRSV